MGGLDKLTAAARQSQLTIDGMKALPESPTLMLLTAFNEAKDGNFDAVPGLLESAAENMRAEGYGDDD